jgi:ribonuclease VapC
MVIDTSALVAILFQEPEAAEFSAAIGQDSRRLVSAAIALETFLVVEARKGDSGAREVDLLFHRGRLEIAAFEQSQLELARDAWRQYGKGRHPAGLNLGDCFSYALAKSLGEPLLFKGSDFAQTDVTPAVPLI